MKTIKTIKAQGVPYEDEDLLTIAYLHGFAKGKDAASAPPAPQTEKRLTGLVLPTHFDAMTGGGIPDPTTFGAPQVSGYGPKMIPQVSGYGEQPETIAVSSTKQASVMQQESVGWQPPFGYLRQTNSKDNPPHGWAFHFEGRPGDVAVHLRPAPQGMQGKQAQLSEDQVWHLARYVYGRSQPHDAPQILLTAKEIKTIIEYAINGIKG